MNRREMLCGTGAGLLLDLAGHDAELARATEARKAAAPPLALADYQPTSMLAVSESRVMHARYPVIDVHTHITQSARETNGIALAAERQFLGRPDELLAVMQRKNLRAMVNLTGGYADGLAETIRRYDQAYPGSFYTFTEPAFARFLEPGYPHIQAELIEQAHRAGARGLKILKTLGLYLRDNIVSGKLIAIDDPRFDPMWDTCGKLRMPVAIHVSDPVAFFLPTDRMNERFEELQRHPDWSFYGRDFPANAELLAARDRVIARHPETRFIVLHVGNFAEDLKSVSRSLDRLPNMSVDIAARIGELGRQPRTARAFFDRYQDRILFGTDATPHAEDYPQQFFGDRLYEIYFRFLESADEYFDYAPANIPPQGRWRIYGIDLPDPILRKVYFENAARELRLASS